MLSHKAANLEELLVGNIDLEKTLMPTQKMMIVLLFFNEKICCGGLSGSISICLLRNKINSYLDTPAYLALFLP